LKSMFDTWKRIIGIKPRSSIGNKPPLTLLFDQWLENKARGPRRVLDNNFQALGANKNEELPAGLRAVNRPDHNGWPPWSPRPTTAQRPLRDPREIEQGQKGVEQ